MLLWFDAATQLFEEAIYFEKSGEISVRAGTAGEVARFDSEGISTAARGTLGYAQVTSSQGSITAETDLTSLTVTVTVGTSRRIRVSAFNHIEGTVATDNAVIRIKESTTNLQETVAHLPSSPAPRTSGSAHSVVLTPSAGSHTYKLSLARLDGTGNVGIGASASQPNYILAEDIC